MAPLRNLKFNCHSIIATKNSFCLFLVHCRHFTEEDYFFILFTGLLPNAKTPSLARSS